MRKHLNQCYLSTVVTWLRFLFCSVVLHDICIPRVLSELVKNNPKDIVVWICLRWSRIVGVSTFIRLMWNNASHRRVRNLTQRHNKQTEAHCEGNFQVVFVKSTTQTRRCKCVIRAWRHYSFISGRFKGILRIVSQGHLLSNQSIDRQQARCLHPAIPYKIFDCSSMRWV